MTFESPAAPTPLTDEHELAAFDCGEATLNDWLKRRALRNERSGGSRTHVLCDGPAVVGYYCLATGAVDHDDAPNALRRNMPDPIPVLVLGRLAVDRRYQNRGLGRLLLRARRGRFSLNAAADRNELPRSLPFRPRMRSPLGGCHR